MSVQEVIVEPRSLPRNKTITITTPISVEWSDLSVVVTPREGLLGQKKLPEKTLLQPTSGFAAPHSMVAIMGPSGCGKTTMLDAIASRLTADKIRGCVTFGGTDLTMDQRQHLVSYVTQEDHMIGVFSVDETLWHAARLTHGFSKSKERLQHLVDETKEAVGLKSASGTKVGDIFRKGLSGGQKRRLSLAIELVKRPCVLVLDEPTSGLDSASAYGLMDNLLTLAKS